MSGGAILWKDSTGVEIYAHTVSWRRARGFQASISSLDFLVDKWPSGLQVATLQPGDLNKKVPAAPVSAAIKAARGDCGRRTLEMPKALGPIGSLAIAYVDRDGTAFTVPVTPCFVTRVETLKWYEVDKRAVLRLYFADARYLLARGFPPRWSFNRQDAYGGLAHDSLKPDGTAFTLADVARELVGSLPMGLKLGNTPKAWAGTPEVNFAPGAPAIAGMAQLTRDFGTVPPCLDLSGHLSFYEPGVGKLGFGDAVKPGNTRDFPKGYQPNATGTEQGFTVEPTYRPEYVIVFGGPRFATVAVDDCEPVLEDDEGNLEPISEELIRRLTGDRFGLRWLHEWVLNDDTLRSHPAIPDPVVELIREQAYLLYRVPGVEVDTSVSLVDESGKPIPGRFVRGPGPNAHLLPVLPRAERTGGRRMRPAAETFKFGPVHYSSRKGQTEEELQAEQIDLQMAQLRERIQVLAAKQNQSNPWHNPQVNRLGSEVVSGLRFAVNELVEEDVALAVSKEQFFSLLRSARIAERAKLVDEKLAQLYQAASLRKWELVDVFHPEPGWAPLYKLCLQIAAAEVELEEREGNVDFALRKGAGFVATVADLVSSPLQLFDEIAGFLEETITGDPSGRSGIDPILERRRAAAQARLGRTRSEAFEESPDLNQALTDQIKTAALAVVSLRRQRERETRLGINPAGTSTPIIGFTNYWRTGEGEDDFERHVDPGARVIDAERGLFRLSYLPGHLRDEGVPSADASSFVPKPVRFVFGTKLRPRTDTPPPPAYRVRTTGSDGSGPATPQFDEEGYYASWWQRTGAGDLVRVDPSRLSDADRKRIRQQALVVRQPSLVELIPLEGTSNRVDLDSQARALAEAAFKGTDKVESAAWTLARPFPVNCDGLIAGVVVRSRAEGKGFETVVEVGDAPLRTNPMRTTTRPVVDDGAREAAEKSGLLL